MSPRQSAKATPITGTRITKRVRAPKKDADETPERARKRALDREAQRTFREKTKNYIIHLEQTVAACEGGSDPQRISQLLAQNAELYRTVERLRKIISDIYTATLPEVLERNRSADDPSSCIKEQDKPDGPPASPDNKSDIAHSKGSPLGSLVEATETTTVIDVPSISIAASGDVVQEVFPEFSFAPMTDASIDAGPEFLPAADRQPAQDGSVSSVDCMNDTSGPVNEDLLGFHADMFAFITEEPTEDQKTIMMTERLQDPQSARHLPGPHAAFKLPLEPRMSSPMCLSLYMQNHLPLLAERSCDFNLWMQTNTIYNQIFAVSPMQASEARNLDSGVLFKAIENGWESLSQKDRNNPVIRILQSYDDLVSKCLDKVNRLAIAYKNHLLIKYFLNRDSQDLLRMPDWQRPTLAQRDKKYPILVDFFAWPGLRERFIRGNIQLECSKFSAAYMRHFRFSWPFSFQDTYQYFSESDTYVASPLFERYHRDLKFWTMEECFFWEFPELSGDLNSSGTWSLSDGADGHDPFETPWLPPMST